ncbi:hypothetical protein MBLNU457_3548t1 [Dothideomycetes sp. NU457]
MNATGARVRTSIYALRLDTPRWTLRSTIPLGQRLSSSSTSSVPRVASTSIWNSIIPKAFRHPSDPVSIAERNRAKALKAQKPKEWNPATFFIVIALLIGSNAIQMIALKNQRRNFSRKAEAKIALLREVIERVQKGEDVDVEGILGTGKPEQEQEWEEVMREIETDQALWQTKQRKRAEKAQKKLEQEAAKEIAVKDTVAPTTSEDTTPRRPGWY